MKIMEIIDVPNKVVTTGKVKRASGTEVEIEDPANPGVTTKVDLKKAKVGTPDSKGVTSIDTTNNKPGGSNQLKPNAKVTLATPKQR